MKTRPLNMYILGVVLGATLGIPGARAEESGDDDDAAAAPEKRDLRAEMRARRAEKVAACMECHADAESAGEVEFKDGTTLPVGVSAAEWEGSVHGDRITCTQCHKGITEYPHPDLKVKSAREFQLASSNVCKKCHYAYHTRVADSIHAQAARKGNDKAPSCVDCHGAHGIKGADQPRADVNTRCSSCHEKVAAAYRLSVHGKALAADGNPDVPLCTDCHGAHAIRDPRKPMIKAASHELCAQCHGDADRMKKYDLSPDVATSYLEDFHGASNVLYAQGGYRTAKPMVTCVDCHGTHEIVSLKDKENANVIRERVSKVCVDCHKDATPTFGDAWLPHYKPTLASAPMVWGIKWVYRIMIPLIMLGLVLHILLHLFRLSTHR